MSTGGSASRRGLARDLPPGAVLLTALVVGCPVALGGVHPPALLAALLLAGACAWLCTGSEEPARRVPWVVLLVASLAIITALQLLPLPRGLLAALDPATAELAASSVDLLVPTAAGLPRAVSLAPPETAVSFGRAILAGLVLWAAVQVTRKSGSSDLVRRATLLALVAVLVVVVAHAVLGDHRVMGLVPPRGRGIAAVQGPFINSNHLGAFLCLLAPVALAEALRAGSRRRATVALGLTGLAVVAAVATMSRSAFLGLAVGALVLVVLERRLLLRRVSPGPAVGIALGLVGTSAMVAEVMTGGRLRHLLVPHTLFDGSDKLRIWGLAVKSIGDHPWVGAGRGAFAAVHWRYRALPYESQAGHAEGGYLQLLVDLGLPLGVAFLVALAWIAGRPLLRAVRHRARSPFESAAIAGLVALAVHEATDISLAVPGVAVPAAALVGALVARWDEGGPALRGSRVRLLAVVASLAGVVAVGWGGPLRLRSIDTRIEATLDQAPPSGEVLDRALRLAALHPSDPWGWARVGGALATAEPAAALPYAGLAMSLDPMGSEPHRVAALALLNLGRPSQALVEMRLAIARANTDLPDLVAALVERWPDREDRLSVLPDEHGQAVRVVRLLGRFGGPELASEAWGQVQRRAEQEGR
jgi:O-antigen ligase